MASKKEDEASSMELYILLSLYGYNQLINCLHIVIVRFGLGLGTTDKFVIQFCLMLLLHISI